MGTSRRHSPFGVATGLLTNLYVWRSLGPHIVAGEGDFEGELARFGHGLQRSYLLTLLQELAGTDDMGGPTLVLACEEPELYQHPPQARHLNAVLHKLSEGNAQVVVSTHSPLFVSGEGFEGVRLIRKNQTKECSTVSSMSYEELAEAVTAATGNQGFSRPAGALAKIHQALQPALNEMFFTPRLILVEGLEDEAYLTAYMNLLGYSEDYRRTGCHIVPVNGKSQLIQPLIIAKHFGIPTYVVFDADTQESNCHRREQHEKDNRTLLTLLGSPDECVMPGDIIWGTGFTMWHSDIGSIVKSDIGSQDWTAFRQKADQHYGHAGKLKKNALHIGASLAFAWEAGKRAPNLGRLCEAILNVENSVSVNGT